MKRTGGPRRFQDRIDELADRLGDMADAFRARRDELLRDLSAAKDEYDDAVLDVEEWAHKEGLITLDPQVPWTDTDGEPFLPVARVEVFTDPVPDLATMFRERVTELLEKSEESDE